MSLKKSIATIVRVLAVALATIAASSCGTAAALAVKADRSATLSVSVEVPAAVEAKLRQFVASGDAASATGASTVARPLFDPASVASSMRARGITVEESVAPTPRSWRGAFRLADLESLAASDPDLSKAVKYARGPGWASLRVSLRRDNASALARLFPGIDADLLEALQPPALYDNPVTSAEYRSMLAGLLGKAAAAAIDGMAFRLSVSLPGAALESGGRTVLDASRRTASLSVPALEAMVLERPVEFFVKWSE